MRLFLCALSMASPSCGMRPAPAPENEPPRPVLLESPEAPSNEEVARQVVDLVVAAQRTYLERGNPRPLSLLFSPNARIQTGRARTAGPFDSEFGKQRFEGVREFAVAYGARQVAEFTTLEARVTLGTAELELRLEGSAGEESYWFGQTFRLVRNSGAWRIVQHRYWPIDPRTGREFSVEYFQELDESIERELREGDRREAAYHMMLAYRFDELASLSRELTNDESADAWAWDLRAKASALVGDREDAEVSLRKARELAAASEESAK